MERAFALLAALDWAHFPRGSALADSLDPPYDSTYPTTPGTRFPSVSKPGSIDWRRDFGADPLREAWPQVSISIADFWRLLGESRLLAPEQVGQLAADFGQMKGAAEGASAKTLAQWLLARNVLSCYQTTILLAGRAGPFHYGDYKVYDRIDSGRLAGQFRAVHAPTGHPVLLQFLTGAVVGDPQLWAAANETLAAASIASPHLQRFFEPVDLQSFKFLVSEDLRGETLDQRLAAGRFPPAEAARIVRLMAIGLAQMHQCGRIHGAVRPANVLLEPIANHPGNVKLLLDAAGLPGPVDFTQQQPGGSLVQMADYLAPELMHAGKAPDPLSDIYALGCTLYAMLSGNPPFAGGTIQQKMARHAAEAIRPLEMFGVPQPLAQLVAYTMAKNPAVRLQSAAIVAEQFASFVDPALLYVPPPQPPTTLAAYEHFIRQKQARLAQPQPAAPVVVKVVAPAADERPLSFRSDREHLGALSKAAAAASPPAAGSGVQLAGGARPGSKSDEILRRREADQKRNVIVALVVAGVVVVTAIVAFNLSGRRNSPVAGGGSGAGDATAGQTLPAGEDTGSRPAITPTSSASRTTSKPVTPAAGGTPAPAKTPAAGSGAEPGLVQELIADDGTSLWASPTNGPPVSFRCVPPEAQMFLILRPAEMLREPEGERVLAALGPGLAAQRAAWEHAAGVKLAEVEQLTISLHNNDAKFPRTAFVVKTVDAIPREQLLSQWGNPAPAQEKGQTYYTGASWAYYIPAEGERTFAMAEPRDIKDVAAAAGAPPRVFRDIERLRQATDSARHFTLLFYPQFLFNDDGEPLFAAERAKVRGPLEWLLGDNLQAAAVSGHLGESFYFELRMLSSLDKRPLQLAEELKGRLNEIPPALEDYFVSLSPPPYWKKLAFRYPSMIRELHGEMRAGVEHEQAIVNSVLPAAAAHNLVLGGELLVATAPGQPADVSTARPPAGPKTIAEALQLKTSYTFDNQSLEFAMRDLAADVQGNAQGLDFTIKIVGPDLQNDGITRNQSIRDFKQENQTVADILTALVLKANPIPGKSAADKEQKLIWVVGPDPDTGQPAVLITTRAAAAAKQYKLPEPFVMK